MAEPRRDAIARSGRPKSALNSAHSSRMSAGGSGAGNDASGSPRSGSLAEPGVGGKSRQVEDILAGLPAHVMDELVEDMADAVVAILLSQAATDADEKDDASGDLR